MKSRYFPDGRDLNRQFLETRVAQPPDVAHQVWTTLSRMRDAIIDLHSAAKGAAQHATSPMRPHTYKFILIAKSFGIEIILDSIPSKGTLRRTGNAADIPVVTYEGGGADSLGDLSVKVAVHGVMNALRSMRMVPGNPQRPKFRIMASGSTCFEPPRVVCLTCLSRRGASQEKAKERRPFPTPLRRACRWTSLHQRTGSSSGLRPTRSQLRACLSVIFYRSRNISHCLRSKLTRTVSSSSTGAARTRCGEKRTKSVRFPRR